MKLSLKRLVSVLLKERRDESLHKRLWLVYFKRSTIGQPWYNRLHSPLFCILEHFMKLIREHWTHRDAFNVCWWYRYKMVAWPLITRVRLLCLLMTTGLCDKYMQGVKRQNGTSFHSVLFLSFWLAEGLDRALSHATVSINWSWLQLFWLSSPTTTHTVRKTPLKTHSKTRQHSSCWHSPKWSMEGPIIGGNQPESSEIWLWQTTLSKGSATLPSIFRYEPQPSSDDWKRGFEPSKNHQIAVHAYLSY